MLYRLFWGVAVKFEHLPCGWVEHYGCEEATTVRDVLEAFAGKFQDLPWPDGVIVRQGTYMKVCYTIEHQPGRERPSGLDLEAEARESGVSLDDAFTIAGPDGEPLGPCGG